MGRIANYPKTIEDCLTVSITKLKEWDYLSSLGTKSGTISWSRNGEKHSSIGISVTNTNFEKFIILDYKSNGEPRNYKIKITDKPSNLGKGKVFYFICPITEKHCTKLYLYNGYFLHREAFSGLMYQKQLESRNQRDMFKLFNACYISDEVYEEQYKKHFKTHYNGKPTKRYQKLMNKIKLADKFPADTMQRLLMM